jgi:uncharacterized protein (DUF1800 family)
MDALSARWPSLGWSSQQVRENVPDGSYDVMQDLVDVHIARAVWSERQLLEIMVDFWSNHLNVTCPSANVWDSRHLFDRDVIRAHALGRFDLMLQAAGHAPAMLNYLGAATSTGDEPNENWGRELLELHTVGLLADYTESDIHNSALILTGLSVDDQGGQFEYKPQQHYVGKVKVLGFSASNSNHTDGDAVAMAYLSYLAHHPLTAARIASKLATRFVCDRPPKSLVASLAKVYLANNTDIVPVLSALFDSQEFASSAGSKIRTPYEDLIATIRVLRLGPPTSGTDAIRDLQWISGSVGQPPLRWYAPNGYADVATAWATTAATVGKWNAHMNLSAGWAPTDLTRPALSTLVPTPRPATYGGLITGLAGALSLPTLPSSHVTALARFAGHTPGDALASTDAALGWQLPFLVALLLDSSGQAIR